MSPADTEGEAVMAEERVSRMCTCAMHCVESPYHETACCQKVKCDCWCHEAKRRRDALREDIGIAQDPKRY